MFFGSLLYKSSKFEGQYPVFQLTPSTEEKYRQMTPLKRKAFHLVSVPLLIIIYFKKNITLQQLCNGQETKKGPSNQLIELLMD